VRWLLTLALVLGSGCDQVFELTDRLPLDAPGPADALPGTWGAPYLVEGSWRFGYYTVGTDFG